MAKLLRARWLLIPVVLVLIIAAYAGWRYLSQWESTDDAQIEGHIHPVNAKVGGTITSVNVRDNQPVEAGTVLVQLDARDYEIAVARAKADLSEAQAGVIAAARYSSSHRSEASRRSCPRSRKPSTTQGA